MLVLFLQNLFVLRLSKVHELEFQMNWTEIQLCLRCNKGDELLFCNEDGCPIVVHKKCLGCEAHFDDFGKFYCPYCIFKRMTEDMRKLREKAIAARKNLSKFIKEEMVDNTNRQKPKSLISTNKEPVSPSVAGNKSVCESERNLKRDALGNHGVHLENHNLEERSPKCTSTHLPCDETDELIVDKQNEDDIQRCSKFLDINECGNNMMMVVYQPQSIPISAHDDGQVLKDNGSLAPELNLQSKFIDILAAQSRKRKNPPEPEVQNANSERTSKRFSFGESNSIQLEQPSKQHTYFTYLNAQRGKLFWTAEEEDMLKEGIENFPVEANKKIPWRKILDFGRHVFNPSRTPGDLKDKWRNIAAKMVREEF